MQVCDGLAPAQSCIPLSLYKCVSFAAWANGAEGVRESAPDLLRCSLTAKGGNRGCWSGCLGVGSAGDQTDRRASTAFLSTLAHVGRWNRAPSAHKSTSAWNLTSPRTPTEISALHLAIIRITAHFAAFLTATLTRITLIIRIGTPLFDDFFIIL